MGEEGDDAGGTESGAQTEYYECCERYSFGDGDGTDAGGSGWGVKDELGGWASVAVEESESKSKSEYGTCFFEGD